MSDIICKEGLNFIQKNFIDFPEISDERLITLAAIAIGVKKSNTLSSETQKFISQMNTEQLKKMANDIVIDKAMSMIENPETMNLGMLAMTTLDNEDNIIGKEASGQSRIETVAQNTEHNAIDNPIIPQAFEEYTRHFIQAQTEAHAYYGNTIDTNFNNRKDKKDISDIIDSQPLDVIALGLVSEKNIEKGMPTKIYNAEDLKIKLNLPEIKELSAKLNTVLLKESIAEAKDENIPSLSLTENRSSNNQYISYKREYA